MGGPTLRLSGHYFAMATIALLQIGLLLMINWDWAGGAVGLEAPIGDAAWMLLFRSKVPYYWIAVGLAFVTFCATYFLVHSRPASTGAPSTATKQPRAAWACRRIATRCWRSCCLPA